MTDEEVRHREAIRALIMRFHIYSDRGKFEDVAACFTSDGVARWTNGGGTGRAEIARNLTGDTANPLIKFVRHHVTTTHIELAPDMASARGRIYFFTITNGGIDHGGVYADEYVREGEEWLFKLREVRLDWQSPDSIYRQHKTR